MFIRKIRTLPMKRAHGTLTLHWCLLSVQFGLAICSGYVLKYFVLKSCGALPFAWWLVCDAFTLRWNFVWCLHSETWNSSLLPKNLSEYPMLGGILERFVAVVWERNYFVSNLDFIKHVYLRIAFCHIYVCLIYICMYVTLSRVPT